MIARGRHRDQVADAVIEAQDRPRALPTATGPTRVVCVRLFAAFAMACAALYPPDKTLEGKSSER